MTRKTCSSRGTRAAGVAACGELVTPTAASATARVSSARITAGPTLLLAGERLLEFFAGERRDRELARLLRPQPVEHDAEVAPPRRPAWRSRSPPRRRRSSSCTTRAGRSAAPP